MATGVPGPPGESVATPAIGARPRGPGRATTPRHEVGDLVARDKEPGRRLAGSQYAGVSFQA